MLVNVNSFSSSFWLIILITCKEEITERLTCYQFLFEVIVDAGGINNWNQLCLLKGWYVMYCLPFGAP